VGIKFRLFLGLLLAAVGQAAEETGALAPPPDPAGFASGKEVQPPGEMGPPATAATASGPADSAGPEAGEEAIPAPAVPLERGTEDSPAQAAPPASPEPARTDLAAAILGLPDIYQTVLHRAMEETGLHLTCWYKGQMEAGLDLSRYQVLFLHRDLPDSPARLRPALQAARKRGAKILSLWPAGAYTDSVNVSLQDHPYLKGYWDSPSVENLKRFLVYTAVTFLGQHRGAAIQPPSVPPPNGIYHPDAPHVFETLADYQKWRPFDPEKPTVAIPFFEFSLSTQNTALLDALIRRLEQDANVLATYGELPADLKPDIIVNQRVYGGGLEPEGLKRWNALGIQPIKLTSGTVEEWEKGPGLLGGSQVSAWVTVPELNGAIEPLVIGWRNGEGLDLPLEERIEKLARRVASWNRLRRQPNAEKRVAIVHYHIGASYLDVPKSLWRLLQALRERGYSVEVPPNEEELLSRLTAAEPAKSGDAAALRRLAAAPSTAKIPVGEYLKWFRGLPEELQRDVIRWWGEPPGKSMVWQGFLLIPQVPCGNVTLVALPSRGESDNPEALYHDLAVPPPHHYIAFYFWLRRGFKADAIVHFGTHGSHEFLPRKQQGLSATDWPDLLIQDVPNIYPYLCVNAVEAITAKRRGYAVMVSHNAPPLRATGLSPALEELHRLLRGYERAEGEPLRQEYRRQILAQIKRATAAGIALPDPSDFDGLVQKAHLLLHRLQEEEAPIGLHVLGEQPEGDDLVSTVLPMLHGELEQALSGEGRKPAGEGETSAATAARSLLDAVLRQGLGLEEAQKQVLGRVDGEVTEQLHLALDYARRIRESDEIGGLLHALEGGYLPSGIGGCPVRNPNVLPTGRNLHAVDPSAIPTKAAWEVGKRMAADLVRQYERENGHLPRKVGFVLFGGETIRHEGIVEAQILSLLGVEPVWGGRGGNVVDLRLIPLAELGRPRIDVVVTTTGQYRDVFGEVMARLQKAVEMAAEDPEGTNYLRQNVQALAQSLQAQGYAPEEAHRLATTRLFAPAVGVYSAGLEAAVPATGTWKTDGQLATFYLERMGFRYGRQQEWGEKEKGLLAAVLKGTEAAVFSRSSKLYGLLDTDHPFGFLGGMSLAVRHLDGAAPKLFITNLRAANQPLVESAQQFMTMEVHTRYLNPEWIREMQKAGYSGAGEMANWVHNLWGWQVTDPTAVDSRLWQAAYEVYVRDEHRLGLPQWLRQRRPEALTSLAQTLLEAVEHGYWVPPNRVTETLRAFVASRSPLPGDERKGRGQAVVSVVPIANPGPHRALPALPLSPASFGRPGRIRPDFPVPPPSPSPVVVGRKMEEVPWQPLRPPAPQRDSIAPAMVALGTLFGLGFLRRRKG